MIPDSYIFHHGLVKLLILYALRKMHRSWDQFLRFEGFAGTDISQEMTSMMPMCAPSNKKGKKKVLDRTSRISSPPTFPSRLGPIFKDNPKVGGMDALKEPIRHSVLETPPMKTRHSKKM